MSSTLSRNTPARITSLRDWSHSWAMRLRNAISSCVKRMSSLSLRNVFFGKALLAVLEKNVFFSYGTAFG
jgi:hypothetical protein